jgi:hypothetical protein
MELQSVVGTSCASPEWTIHIVPDRGEADLASDCTRRGHRGDVQATKTGKRLCVDV